MTLISQIQELTTHPLGEAFYSRPTVAVARELLGKILIVRENLGKWQTPSTRVTAGRIVETEAYCGDDPASHSARGETPRCSVMFGKPGNAYVYFIYGMYEMLNFVTEPEGSPGAVLIRALEPFFGEGLMKERTKKSNLHDLTTGPGKLCKSFGITMNHNRHGLQGPFLYVCDDGFKPSKIHQSPRVGISQGIEKKWRFFLPAHPFVSKAKQNREAEEVNIGQTG